MLLPNKENQLQKHTKDLDAFQVITLLERANPERLLTMTVVTGHKDDGREKSVVIRRQATSGSSPLSCGGRHTHTLTLQS